MRAGSPSAIYKDTDQDDLTVLIWRRKNSSSSQRIISYRDKTSVNNLLILKRNTRKKIRKNVEIFVLEFQKGGKASIPW